MSNDTITAVTGVEVGHWTDVENGTGTTVVVFPEPNVAGVEIRGAAPGSRETALLAPGMRVEQIQAIVLSGGSAFGLATADGVMQALEADDRGHPTPFGRVPIVPAAVVFDLQSGAPGSRPGPAAGAAAYAARTSDPVALGRVGAGTGCTVANWRGAEAVMPGGVGSAAIAAGGHTVGALAVVNAAGDVFALDGTPLTGGPHEPGPPAFILPPLTQTTLVVVAVDARLDRIALSRLAIRSQDALAACVRPGHTRYDGDVAFVVACGDQPADPDVLGEAAFVATGRAIEAAIRSANG
jgi:L-aminopeptidase/D-esterase-like protein